MEQSLKSAIPPRKLIIMFFLFDMEKFISGITKQKQLKPEWKNRPNNRMVFLVCLVVAVPHPDLVWAYRYLEVKDWIV